MQAKLETVKRKQKYKELIEKGTEVSKYLEKFVVQIFCLFMFGKITTKYFNNCHLL